MSHNDLSILILKPTPAFLAFVAMQLPDYELPDISELQQDNTAYSIRRYEDDEATLSELQRLYPYIFQYEISRLLGTAQTLEAEISFVEFLSCFKFEIHSQIMLMESSIKAGHQLLCIKPKSVTFNWIPKISEGQIDCNNLLFQINLPNIDETATVIVKNFHRISEIKLFIKHYYQPIFYAEMFRMIDRIKQWPVINSFKLFKKYFEVETHTQLVHLY